MKPAHGTLEGKSPLSTVPLAETYPSVAVGDYFPVGGGGPLQFVARADRLI
jgi:hypothetical protein